MSTLPELLYLRDIVAACERISHYIGGMSPEDFQTDEKTIDAVLHNVVVIGEAVTRLPESVLLNNPDIPWRAMRGMRNVIVHEYIRIDLSDLWDTVTGDIPEVLPRMVKLADDLAR